MTIFLIAVGGLCLVIDNGGDKSVLASKILVPIFAVSTAIMRYFHRNSCYKVVIDNKRGFMKLFLMFNQGVVETKTSDIKIVVDRNINCLISERKIVILNLLLHDLISLLPEKTDIKFVGFFGKQLEKELIINNRKSR